MSAGDHAPANSARRMPRKAFRRLIGGLAAEIPHLDFSSCCGFKRLNSAAHGLRYMKHIGCLPDTHVLRGVFRALGIVPGYPSYVHFCAEGCFVS